MKQLAKRERKLEKQMNALRVGRRRTNNSNRGAVTATQIPMEIAYTVRQPTTRRVHVETACEYIGDFVITPTSTQGDSVKFMLNPLTMSRTRLYNIARNYQKYRFRRAALKIQSSTTTSTNGLYVVGYNSNPDAEYTKETAVPAIFNLPGAQSANVWRTITSEAKLEDRNKWYNLDPDSEEIMMTTQGYFAVAVQSPVSTTGALIMPVLLEYTVEFTGSAYNLDTAQTAFIWPSGTWAYNSVTGNFTFTPDAGETPGPTISSGQAFIINPVYPINLGGVEDIIGVVKGTTASWVFYRDVEAFADGQALPVNTTFKSGRTTWQKILN